MTAATAPTGATGATGATAAPIPLSTRLAGASDLFRLAWRRDRILVPASVLGLVVLAVGSAQATLELYPTDEAAATGLAGVLSNPSVIALYGPIASHTADALAVFKTVMLGAFLTAVLGFVVVRRHTRTEEDEGRLELLGAGVVGRWSPLAAAVTLATIAVVAASALSAAGLAALGMDVTGSIAFGVSWLAAGLATVGVTAVVVQLASTTRGAAGLGFGFLGAMYALRAIADSADSGTWVHALGWLSPLGWAGRVEAYGADRQWVLLLGLLTLVGGVLVGVAVLDRRDLGAGLIPVRDGPRRAGPLLTGPVALVTRLARGTIIGWTVGMVLGGAVVGSLLGSVAELSTTPASGTSSSSSAGRPARSRTSTSPPRSTSCRRPSPPRGSPSCCASSGPSARAWARSCSRPRRAAPGGSAPTSSFRWSSPPPSWPSSAQPSAWWGPRSRRRPRRSAPRSAPPWPRSRRCG